MRTSPRDVIALILKTSTSKNPRIFIQEPIDWLNGRWNGKQHVQKPRFPRSADVRAARGKIDVPMSRKRRM